MCLLADSENITYSEARNDSEWVKAMDEEICPVIGTATSVLPPDHPSLSGKNDSDVCPVTNAKLGDHKGKIHEHPSVDGAAKGAVCPVVGKSA